MTVQSFDYQTLLDRRARLFTPQPRLGWTFQDRWSHLAPFTEPPPIAQRVPPELAQRARDAEQLVARRMRRVFPLSAAAFIVLLLFAGCAATDDALSGLHAPFVAFVLALICGAPGCVVTGFALLRRQHARAELERAQRERAQAYDVAAQAWQARKHAHEHGEYQRLNELPEWGPVPRPAAARRLDVFGGTLWSWEALLTTYGCSTLTAQPLLVVDLSREIVCRELTETAQAAGVSVDAQLLPSRLASSTLLSGLDSRGLVDALVESVHGEGDESSRSDRAMDDRILSKICDALGTGGDGRVTLGRIAAALRALMGEPDDTDLLDKDERRRIATELFSVEYRRQAHQNLSRIEAHIHPLEDLGTHPDDRTPGYLTCIALDSQARNVRSELLTDLVAQWVTHRVAGSDQAAPAVVIAGADELARRHLERLSDVCERRGVPLTLLFRRLRETSGEMLGGGAVAFMRLGNYEDATRAADFVGRDYRFVLSQITKNVGGNESHTRTGTYGEAEGDTFTESRSTGTSTSWGTTRSSGVTHSGGGPFGFFPDRSSNRGTSRTSGGGTSETDTTGRSTSTTRNWSSAYSYAEGTNWSDADTTQRVYEYAVEPIALQHLPDHALLLVESTPGGGRKLSAVECDPAIVTLDRVTTDPLPRPPPPGHAVYPAHPAAAGRPQWTAPPAVEPPRTPLPYAPGPPPGQQTGPRPPRPPRRRPDPGPPPRGGPPPLFGRPEE